MMQIHRAHCARTYSMTMHENPRNFKNIPFYTTSVIYRNGFRRLFAALKPPRPGVSWKRSWFPVKQWDPCLGASPLSLGTGSEVCWRADGQPDVHGPQGAAEGPWVGDRPVHPLQPWLSPLLLLPLPPPLSTGSAGFP